MDAKPLRFIRRGETVTLHGVPPDRPLLDLLREDLHCTGTKEGCGEGDCGACTVVVAEPAPEGADRPLTFRAVNSCIRLAHSVDGLALWTVEDLAAPDGALHPAQESLARCHGSQCGFCTPGFAMSLFGMYQNHVRQGETITPDLARAELSGNLCRCTGYRPILEAACQMQALPAAPAHVVDEAALAERLRVLQAAAKANLSAAPGARGPTAQPASKTALTSGASAPTPSGASGAPAYLAPTTLAELVALRAAHPQAQLVAGCTDVGLWITKQHRQYAQVLDVTRAHELRQCQDRGEHLAIGAAVSLQDAFNALVARRPQLAAFASRFAGLPVRNAGTLGGNVANGSPIGDSMPLLIALGAKVVLASVRGERALALEDFYLGYRKTALAEGEVVARLEVPHPAPGEFLRAYKISKRYDDDISAVCLVVALHIEGAPSGPAIDAASRGSASNGPVDRIPAGARVRCARIGAGGVAATPARATQAEAALAGQPWTEAAARSAGAALQAQFSPISDMRASDAYRRQVLANLMQRLWLESQGQGLINLEAAASGRTLLGLAEDAWNGSREGVEGLA